MPWCTSTAIDCSVGMNDALGPASRIFVAGHRGMVGSAIARALRGAGYSNVVTRTRAELDLTQQAAVRRFFTDEPVECVVLAAAKVGGILANETWPADFIYENLAIETNVIEESRRAGVRRLLFLGSSCIYPRDCPQPIREEYLLTGPLEKTNKAYALAKIAGIEMCASYNRQHGTQYLCVMPTNLYGLGDNYDLKTSHVLPALIRKAHEARTAAGTPFVAWGTGNVRRELLLSDDLAGACVLLLQTPWARLEPLFSEPDLPMLNIGTGSDLTIREIAELVCSVVGYRGEIEWDTTKPDGTPRKQLDVSRIHSLGWTASTPLPEGIRIAYADFLARAAKSAAHHLARHS
jgi:GDP-L-fucose synthase